MTQHAADIVIIGGGIAGISLGAELSTTHSVIVLESEAMPGTQATGRSAANWEPAFGPPAIRALTLASGPYLRDPPAEFGDTPLLTTRGVLTPARADQQALMPTLLAQGYHEIDRATALKHCPALRHDRFDRFLFDPECADVDVDRLLQGWLRWLRRNGGQLLVQAELRSGRKAAAGWTLESAVGSLSAALVVIAAGAWSDVVASRLGAQPIGLVPKRRSAAIVSGSGLADVAGWSQVAAIDERFYAKPTGGKLMISPADADTVEPHDAWADDFKLAEAIEALHETLDVEVLRIERNWGGLRSFVADGLPVVGFDPECSGVFWLAGQGGYGIQTAPAISQLAAALIRGVPPDDALAISGDWSSELANTPERRGRNAVGG